MGGGLAGLWQAAEPQVTALGSDNGEASDADVVVVAVRSSEIADALSRTPGASGKVTIDAPNDFYGRDEDFESLAQQVGSIVDGPTAKAFNLTYAAR